MSTAYANSFGSEDEVLSVAALERHVRDRVERSLRRAVDEGAGLACPPRLRAALLHAVFPGGARLRPTLCLAVASACGDARPELADAAASALELVHCASLAHDDLPCFDDAALRRGEPTVHKRFGESTAVLAGDALIVLAFRTLARSEAPELAAMLAEAVGPARGIIAGQAWEDEPVDTANEPARIDVYHRAKTAALFEAAAAMGARTAGADPSSWSPFGEALGLAYQAADDLLDAIAEANAAGKSTGRDAALNRPSVVRAYGVEAARRRVRALAREASEAIPRCADPTPVKAWLAAFAAKLGW